MPNSQSSNKFVIVAFGGKDSESSGSMEVIPSCWMRRADSAWWPPKTVKSMHKIAEMVRKQVMPNEAIWQLLTVKVLGKSGKAKHECYLELVSLKKQCTSIACKAQLLSLRM
jgi:hypothetical protein